MAKRCLKCGRTIYSCMCLNPQYEPEPEKKKDYKPYKKSTFTLGIEGDEEEEETVVKLSQVT